MPEKKKSSEPNWKKIRAEYIRGGISLKKLAEKHGVSFSTLRKVSSREKWTDLKNKTKAKVEQKVSDSIADQEAKRAIRIQAVADKILDRIEEKMEHDNAMYMLTSKDVKELTDAIKNLREIHGIRNALDVEEQKARIEKLRHDAKEETQDNTIKIVIGAEAEEYAE